MKFFATAFITIFLVCSVRAQNNGCIKLTAEETTRQGYFERVVYKEKKAFRNLRGTVVLGFEGEPSENVFVEIFAYDAKEEKLKRVAGCRTKADGKFSFSDLAKGKYTMLFSKDGGYEITEIYIKVSPNSKRTNEIKAVLEVGK